MCVGKFIEIRINKSKQKNNRKLHLHFNRCHSFLLINVQLHILRKLDKLRNKKSTLLILKQNKNGKNNKNIHQSYQFDPVAVVNSVQINKTVIYVNAKINFANCSCRQWIIKYGKFPCILVCSRLCCLILCDFVSHSFILLSWFKNEKGQAQFLFSMICVQAYEIFVHSDEILIICIQNIGLKSR